MNTNSTRLGLVGVNEPMPAELEFFLEELGAGDVRFLGTTFGRGECDLQTFLQQCRDEEYGRNIPADRVPQSTLWLVDGSNRMIGMVRVRHRLNERLLQYGGNIGYYIRPTERGKGYAKKALRMALQKLRQLGATRALVTVHPFNGPSIQVVEANGGVQDGQGKDAVSGEVANRYWIELQRR